MTRKRSTQHKSARHTGARNTNLPLWVFIGLVLVSAVIIYVLVSPGPQGGQAATISVDQAYQKYSQGGFLLDVRTQEEWDDFHVPGTTWIPLDELPQRLSELPSDTEIVVICRSGNRSKQGRDILLEAGFENVSSMDGGLKEWQARGYPLE